MKRLLTFEIRATLSGTQMFTDEIIKIEISILDINTLDKALRHTLRDFVNEYEYNNIKEVLIKKLPNIESSKSQEIVNLGFRNTNGSLRILAKRI